MGDEKGREEHSEDSHLFELLSRGDGSAYLFSGGQNLFSYVFEPSFAEFMVDISLTSYSFYNCLECKCFSLPSWRLYCVRTITQRPF